MNPCVEILSYWSGVNHDPQAPGGYDHTTELNDPTPELDRCLSSLEKVIDLPRVIILVVCPLSATVEVSRRVSAIAAAHPRLNTVLVTNVEAARISDAVGELAPKGSGECVSLRGYGAIRNMGLAVAAIFGHDTVIFLDDDEVVLTADFMKRALYAVGMQTRAGQAILVKSGYFYNDQGSPYADESKNARLNHWWPKRAEFNAWMKKALTGTRICRSNYVCGGLLVLHAQAFSMVPFDPFITRGEDLDYLFNMRMFGLDVWFDNKLAVKHLPPRTESLSSRFMQNVYRWYYERTKIHSVNRRKGMTAITPSSLMPYPGHWISNELDERVERTALLRMMLTREHLGYFKIWRDGKRDARRYAEEYHDAYLRFQSFWPTIFNGLWRNASLAALWSDGA